MSKNLNRIMTDFINEYMFSGTYASKEELEEVLLPVLKTVKENPDYDKKEWIDLLLEENVDNISKFMRKNSLVPGYTIGVNVGNTDIKLYGGTMDGERLMPENALFDIASMTKLYTQIIAYNLISEGAMNYCNKVFELDSRFSNLGDLRISDIMMFGAPLETKGGIKEKKTVEEAHECLYSASVKKIDQKGNKLFIGQYEYNDIGMMILKEVMENVTGESYETLVQRYITDKLNLSDTHIIVPENKIHLITGTPNAQYGLTNDHNTIALRSSGAAGVFTTSDDLTKVGKSATSILMPKHYARDLYTYGLLRKRGMCGNTYVSMETGVTDSLVDRISPTTSFAIQGSTRGQLNGGYNQASTIMFNPCSLPYEIAKQHLDSSKKQIGEFSYVRDGKEVTYKLVDGRFLLPIREVEPIITLNAKLTLRLMLLDRIIAETEKEQKETRVKRRVI